MPSYNEGMKEGYCLALGGLYRARFGDTPETLRAAIETVNDEETLRRWVVLAGTGSVEDIAAAVLGAGISDGASVTG
jgi:hypothetical protein